MTSRGFLVAVPTLLFAFALGASCSSNMVQYPPLSGGTGGSTTSQSSSSSGGGAGGAGGADGSSDACSAAADKGCPGAPCEVDTDCTSDICTGTPPTCTTPTCSDHVQNGDETDVDCGGGSYMGAAPCPACPNGDKCDKDTDCVSMSCVAKVCAAPTCTDGVQNGNETDVDCGGGTCPPCGTGKKCDNSGANCVNKICTNDVCVAPTCMDNVQNGDETDIDCGGGSYMGLPACPPCDPGQKCVIDSDCVGDQCQTTCQCPVGMVPVPITGGGVYCIDSVEVTYAQYDVFYTANPVTTSQDAWCMWNTGWTPAGAWPYSQAVADEPVRYVNWCQAAAYCKYNGHYLCGQIGGGSVAQASFADSTKDEWYNACSAQGANAYPYGGAYVSLACNGFDSVTDGGTRGPGGDMAYPNCLGGETGLFNMSGNVSEWEDSCSGTTGASDTCAIRGGSYLDDATNLRCDSGQTSLPITQARNYADDTIGFRCCL